MRICSKVGMLKLGPVETNSSEVCIFKYNNNSNLSKCIRNVCRILAILINVDGVSNTV